MHPALRHTERRAEIVGDLLRVMVTLDPLGKPRAIERR
jgi:hypothetical protein